jgi:hypothetical protein
MKKVLKFVICSGCLFSTLPLASKVIATDMPTHTTNQDVVENRKEVYSTNKTIQFLVSTLKNNTPEYIDNYFKDSELQDNQKIIAIPGKDEDGGIAYSSDPNFIGVVANITDENGNETIYDLSSKDATTVREVKEVLRKVQQN